MGRRRSSRELALKFLYQTELNRGEFEEQMQDFTERSACQGEVKKYMTELVDAIAIHKSVIDGLLEKCCENWTLSRMSVIDRNILRIATCELMFQKDVPPKVAIDEAVEIAKKFGSDDSPDFINGVLDRVKKELEKELAEPTPGKSI
ncbi:MAG: transcription antitermination factor NusB [Nitrospinae bacterium]|nr:transcription antitermination factor NusB [Nitrospinota bacterium]